MDRILVVALGGALGSVFRYGLSSWVEGFFVDRSFPSGVFVCNVLGSFIIGLLAGVMISKTELNALWRYFLVVGLCGGFTTFSSFSLDNLTFLRQGYIGLSLVNMLLSVGLCLLMTYLGMKITLSTSLLSR